MNTLIAFTSFKRRLACLLVLTSLTVALAACDRRAGHDVDHHTIGLITNNANGLRNVEGFKSGMAALGYVEGKNVTYRFAGRAVPGPELDAAIREMVTARVDLIFTAGTPTGVSAHRVTRDSGIPVVFGVIADPVAAGVMTDLTRPGGNMTGVRLSDNQDRRLELLLELVPGVRRVLLPLDPTDSANVSAAAQLEKIAPDLRVQLVKPEVRTDAEVLSLLRSFDERVDAVFLVPGTTINAHLPEVLAFARARRIPVSAPSTAQVEEGALTAYGLVHRETGVQAARMAAQILKGTKPGDIPVETAEFYLSINLDAADAIGLVVPGGILKRADFVIRAPAAGSSDAPGR